MSPGKKGEGLQGKKKRAYCFLLGGERDDRRGKEGGPIPRDLILPSEPPQRKEEKSCETKAKAERRGARTIQLE